jgi:curli biogenesis system outer membrane secretion channel CsgG
MKRSYLLPLIAASMLGLTLTACATSTTTVSKTAPSEYKGPMAPSGKPLIEQMQWAAKDVKPAVVFMVGKCEDETGKLLDAEQLRYSRAVTQGCPSLLANYLRTAGFQVVERDPYNMGLISQEYQLSHQIANVEEAGADGIKRTVSKNVGLIQRGGPNGGLTGANYLITGGITTYSTSLATGGGGVDKDGIGVSRRYSEAEVGVTLRIVDVATGLTVSSLYLKTSVKGSTTSFHLTRYIGNVTSTLATVTGGTSAATILRPTSDSHVVSAEFGGARQLPIDYAVIDAIVANIARQVEVGQDRFYKDATTKPIRFDYNVGTK